MRNIAELLNELVEKKTKIEQLKAAHPEMTEIAQLVEEYTKLFEEVCQLYQQSQPTYLLYPVYPSNPPVMPYQWICGSSKEIVVTWDVDAPIGTTCSGGTI